MNENVSNISSIKEMVVKIQEDLIALIKEHVESSKVRFWLPDERLDEDEIYNIYNSMV